MSINETAREYNLNLYLNYLFDEFDNKYNFMYEHMNERLSGMPGFIRISSKNKFIKQDDIVYTNEHTEDLINE